MFLKRGGVSTEGRRHGFRWPIVLPKEIGNMIVADFNVDAWASIRIWQKLQGTEVYNWDQQIEIYRQGLQPY